MARQVGRGASPQLPEHAEVVVLGGGVIGLSTAYQLARAGVDVVLVERDALGSGSTCKAAGGVRAQFSDEVNIHLARRSLEVYERFEELFDQPIDLHQVGYLFLLDDPADVAAFERAVALQNSLGVTTRMLDPDEAGRMSPLIRTDGLLAAAFHPRDGHCTPESVVQGYARAARRAGATVVTGCAATGGQVVDGRVRAVETEAGTIRTEQVVVATGAWSAEVGSWFGVDLPVHPLRRQVLTTGPVPGRGERTPFTIDFSTSFYFHDEGPGLLVGMSDPHEQPGFRLDRDDAWLPGLAAAIERRAPALSEVELRSGWAGLYEMTPDHNGLVGRSRTVPGVVYATGFSGHGFLLGPAVGETVADLVLGRPPETDVAALSVDRFADARSLVPEKHIV
ncbi:FAD-binding oxidoreductase [Ornithinimicrobium humiphilum]|uniref:Sarcosine oxidase subunit beta n=1 Tax=Ornithinimicrobium humiphilum TaxID=125288 RepID=A0A543KN83_9MICO|nr:FAD-binding oxidoreductase [Ornithinimicrobium humiphilum]TQM96535.1 sarcosine oxidase subunit beta [Ornithinimicrobium humiphilum]